MNTLKAGRSWAEVLLAALAIFPCQVLAAQTTTEDPNRHPGPRRLQPQVNSGKGGLKWSQAPQQFDPATPFIFNGWGQTSSSRLHQIAADDWRCDDDQPVTGLQWWGSFQGWTQPAPPSDRPLAFHIAIWTDSATAQAGDAKAARGPQTQKIAFGNPSHPGTIIWQTLCTHWTWNVAGYHSDPRHVSDDTSFQFTCLLSQDEWFRPPPPADGAKNSSAIYWLSIAAVYDPNAPDAKHSWGWTTRPQFFHAGGVQIENLVPTAAHGTAQLPALGSQWNSGKTIEFPQGTAWDYAFELLTNQATNSRVLELAPVYRFRSDRFGDYLYTIDETEKTKLLRDPRRWRFEGVAFYAFPPDCAPVGCQPVYRLWSDRLHHHSYAISESERQKLLDDRSQGWTCEGAAWYAFD